MNRLDRSTTSPSHVSSSAEIQEAEGNSDQSTAKAASAANELFVNKRAESPDVIPAVSTKKPAENPQEADLSTLGLIKYSIDTDQDTRERYVWVSRRVAKTKGQGFGTRSTRYLMEISFTAGCEGRLRNDASYSSHIFHLYMGMIPCIQQVGLANLWGMCGEWALSSSKGIVRALKANVELDDRQKDNLNYLKKMLKYNDTGETKIEVDDITNEAVVSRFSEIEDFNNRTISYIEVRFMPQIIAVLKRNPDKRTLDIDTSAFASIKMEMSEEGIKRWREAIETNTSFTPFRKFEQLRPHTNAKQIARLDKILAEREKLQQKA